MSPTSWFAQLVSVAKLPKLISLIKNVGIIFCNMWFILSIFIFMWNFHSQLWRENTGISYWASFSVLRYGIQLLLQYSVFSIHLMMLEYLLCVLNMQFCSSAGLYWHNFLRLVMIVQDLNRRMNSQLDYLIWLPF